MLTDTIYVRFDRERVRVRSIRKQRDIERPAAATGERLSLGYGMQSAELQIFAHPRLVIADVASAAWIILDCLRELYGRTQLLPGLTLVLHPQVTYDDGLTPLEIESLDRVAARCGARRVVVWVGPELADHELRYKELAHRPGVWAGRPASGPN